MIISSSYKYQKLHQIAYFAQFGEFEVFLSFQYELHILLNIGAINAL